MKILEINQWLAPGGGERFIVDLSNELSARNGIEVYVCTYMDDKDRDNGFYKSQLSPKVHYVNLKGKQNTWSKIKMLFSVLLLIFKIRPDIVHCHLSAFYFVLIPSIIFRNIKFVNTIHNLASKDIKPGFEKCLKKIAYRYFIHPVTISPMCYESFMQYMGFNTSTLIDNGCREIKITQKFDGVRNEILSYKRTDKTKVLINVARIFPQKNQKLLVESFNILINQGYDAILLILGSMTSCPALAEELKRINHTDRVYFLGSKDNVPDYLYNSDAFCLSSSYEGAPISLLEAGFAGCYPLCTPVGGCKDTIIDRNWGLLSKDLSTDSYVKMLIDYMEKGCPSREKISNLYQSKYTMRECANKYINLFREP